MRSDEVIIIAGSRGSGKTTLAKSLIKGLKRVLVYDPMQEYDHKISYHPNSDSIEEFEKIATYVWETGNILFVVDEAERYLRNMSKLPINTFKIINSGRHRNIGLMVITRRLSELHKTPFSMAAVVYLFYLFIPNDIKYISEFYPNGEQVRYLKKFEYLTYSNG